MKLEYVIARTQLENLSDDANAYLYVIKYFTISLYF